MESPISMVQLMSSVSVVMFCCVHYGHWTAWSAWHSWRMFCGVDDDDDYVEDDDGKYYVDVLPCPFQALESVISNVQLMSILCWWWWWWWLTNIVFRFCRVHYRHWRTWSQWCSWWVYCVDDDDDDDEDDDDKYCVDVLLCPLQALKSLIFFVQLTSVMCWWGWWWWW